MNICTRFFSLCCHKSTCFSNHSKIPFVHALELNGTHKACLTRDTQIMHQNCCFMHSMKLQRSQTTCRLCVGASVHASVHGWRMHKVTITSSIRPPPVHPPCACLTLISCILCCRSFGVSLHARIKHTFMHHNLLPILWCTASCSKLISCIICCRSFGVWLHQA